MQIDGNLIPILAISVGFAIAVVSRITQYKLKVEQIKADALVRAEEVRTKNQLELEKLIRQDQNNPKSSYESYGESSQAYDENSKTKSRVRE